MQFMILFIIATGGEWDYVIFSLVRSLPEYKIEGNPTMGWCKQNMGFITDKHQINVALTRARKGLIIVGAYSWTTLTIQLIICYLDRAKYSPCISVCTICSLDSVVDDDNLSGWHKDKYRFYFNLTLWDINPSPMFAYQTFVSSTNI